MVRVRIVLLVALALTVAACSSAQTVPPTTQNGVPSTTTVPPTTQPTPAVDMSVTPVGWVPVAYRDAQVSVPAAFSVFYPDQIAACSFPRQPGSLFVAPTPVTYTGLTCGRPHSNTNVIVRPMGQVPPAYANEKPTILNGVSVYLGAHGVTFITYYAPSLGVEVTARGPMARRIVDTLCRSPRAVALASGSAPSVPSSWRSVTFAGLRFSAPADWPVTRTQDTTGLGDICGTPGVALSHRLLLSTDQRPFVVPFCPIMLPRPQMPLNGVQVDSGLRTEPNVTPAFSHHCLQLHGLTACPATSPAYSILVLKVTVPGRAKPVFVSVGLAGNGVVARTILYSLRAA